MYFYFVIATIDNADYLTKIKAETARAAEHAILDLSVCDEHTSRVTACMAYPGIGVKLDIFISHALSANPVSFDELKKIIRARNAEILDNDAAEERIAKIEKQMKELQKELEEAKAIFAK